jgi:hypothetical protein
MPLPARKWAVAADLVCLGEVTLDGRVIGEASMLRCEHEWALKIGLNPIPFALRRLAAILSEGEPQRLKFIKAHRATVEADE